MALCSEIINLIRLDIADDLEDVGRVGEVAIVQEELLRVHVRVLSEREPIQLSRQQGAHADGTLGAAHGDEWRAAGVGGEQRDRVRASRVATHARIHTGSHA